MRYPLTLLDRSVQQEPQRMTLKLMRVKECKHMKINVHI